MTQLPPTPDFEAIDAAAPGSAERRTAILALIGNLVFSWSNNESLFIYVLMLLLETDERSAAVVFATLNTTRARIELIERLAKMKVTDRPLLRDLERIIERFDDCTRERNEFNHCLYTVDEHGVITHTQSIKIKEVRGRITWSAPRPMDDARIAEALATVNKLKALNRDLWGILPQLESHLRGDRAKAARERLPKGEAAGS